MNNMQTSKKFEGGMSTAIGALTGINPVFLQLFGLDKAAKWAGGKALSGLSNLKNKAIESILGPKGENNSKQKTKAKDADGDGIANGSAQLKSASSTTLEEIKENVKSISERLVDKSNKKDDEEKKDDAGFLSGFMGIVTTILGFAAPAAVSALAFFGKDIVESMLGKVLHSVGLNEELAKSLAGGVAEILPGAILGFKFGGLTGALVGGGLSFAYFTIKDYVDKFNDLSNGKIPDDVGGPWKGMFKGALMGAMIGMAFGPVGLLAGAVLGALGGGIVGFIEESKTEQIKAAMKKQQQVEDLNSAAKQGIKYSGKGSDDAIDQGIKNLQEMAKTKQASPHLNYINKNIKKLENTREELDDYEKDRKKVEKKAKEKFGTNDLSALSLDQLESIMDDDDAEFEAYLNELAGQGYLVNNEETRRSLRHIWTENENTLWGENKKAKEAVFNKVHSMVSQRMQTEQEILNESSQQQADNNTKTIQQTMTQNTISQDKPTVGDTAMVGTINYYAGQDINGQ